MKLKSTENTNDLNTPGLFKSKVGDLKNIDSDGSPSIGRNLQIAANIELREFSNEDKKSKKVKEKAVPIKKLFKFATRFDYVLIVIGSICAAGAAVVYPLVFLLYGRIVNIFIDYMKDSNSSYNSTNSSTSFYNFTTTTTTTSANTVKCLSLNPVDESSDSRMNSTIPIYVGFGFISVFLNYVAHVCWNTAGEKQIKKMREVLYKTIIRQDMAFFDKNSSGDLNSILTNNIETVKFGIGFKFSDCIHLISRGAACIIFALVQAWKFSIVFIAIIPFMILSTTLMVLFTRKYTIEEFKAYGKAGSIAQEALSSIRTVLSLGLQKKLAKKYDSNLGKAEGMAQKKGLISGLFLGLSDFLIDILFGVGVYWGVYLARYECDKFLPGNILQSFFCIFIATFSIGQALPFFKDLAEARGAAKKIMDIIDTKSAIDVFDQTKGIKLNDLKGEIEFDNVVFSYPQRKEFTILKGLSFRIPAGKTVALVGSSGGGKSTVVSLLQRFYLPSSGQIKIDG
ncbi:unnamed protein product, partial [Brachionus calyciflorus]